MGSGIAMALNFLPPLEEAELKAAEYYSSLTELVEEVYQSDMEMMGL